MKSMTDMTWNEIVTKKAWSDLKGNFVPGLGYIVDVLRIHDVVSKGIIRPWSGIISHNVMYDAIVQIPMKGEVIDAVVFEVLKESVVFCYLGYMFGIVNYEVRECTVQSYLDWVLFDLYKRTVKNTGLIISFYYTGFVSIKDFTTEDDFEYKEIPADVEGEMDAVYVSVSDQTKILMKGSLIRLRILERCRGNTGFVSRFLYIYKSCYSLNWSNALRNSSDKKFESGFG
jgi:DNA-directed RNA polymerase subunit E'/Rpb7